MQTNRNVDPMERLHNSQEERVPYAPFLLPSRIPGTTGTSIWIDRVAQRDIFSTIFTDEENHCVFPSPAPLTLPRHIHSHLNNFVKVHSRDTQPIVIPRDTQGMYIPTLPQQTIWHYETPEYEAESSLSSLSIIANRSPVPLVPQVVNGTDTLDTLSGYVQDNGSTHLLLGELDADAHDALTLASSIVPPERTASENGQPQGTVKEDTFAFQTTRSRTHSPLAQGVWAACTRSALAHGSFAFKLLERLRWWLLIPGRLEFLFWLGGAILLISSICIFLFATPVSIGWMGAYGRVTLPATHQSAVSCPSVQPSSPLTKLLLFMLHR